MMLTNLADVVRTSGLPVIEIPGWRTRGHGQMTAAQTIVCHHTAGPKTGNYPSLETVRDGRPDLDGPLAHLGLGRQGTVYVIAAGVCWHAGAVFFPYQDNWHAIGIEAEATGKDPWPALQYNAYARLCAALRHGYNIPNGRVLGHKEVAKPKGRKPDPNFDMAVFRAAVDRAYKTTPPAGGDSMSQAEVTEIKNYIKTETDRAITANEKSNLVWAAYVNRYGLQTEDERERGRDAFDAVIAGGGTVAAASAAMWQILAPLDASLAQAQDNAR